MKEYTILFSLRPAVKLDPKMTSLTLEFMETEGSRKVTISKIEDEVAGHKIQSGLLFRVFLQANNAKEAIAKAKSFVDGVVSFITLITGIGLLTPREELAYEVTPQVNERDFMQIYHDPFHVPISRRNLDNQLLIQLIDHFTRLNPYISSRIARGIRWYRMGTMTSDIFDRFNCFWIGLEALNPVLQEKFSVLDDMTKCPKCGYEWVSMPTISGIRTFIQNEIPEGKTLYRLFRELRNHIMHSKEKLENIQKEVSDAVPKLAEVLFRAICFALGLKEWKKVPYKVILEQIPLHIELEAILVGGVPESLGIDGKDPFFEAKHEGFTIIQSDKEVTLKVTSNFTARLNPEVKWRPIQVRFYGDPEVTGSIVETKIQKQT